jgi:putative flippase GtrA
MSYELSLFFSYLCGMTTTFVLSRRFVFSAVGGSMHQQYLRFGIVNLVTFAQVWLVSVGLARLLFPAFGFEWYPDTVAHAIGISSLIATSYLGHKHFSFR